MKKIITTAAAITLIGSGAIAGSVDAPAPDAIVTPIATPAASVTDFSGFYSGLTLGSISEGKGTYLYDGVPGDNYGLEGEGYGLFGGYNWQRGALVYGAEIAALSVDGQMPDSFFANPHLNSVIDLKGRLGYVMGDVLAFGFVGYSSGDWDNDNGLTNPNMTGPNYGIGLDYLIQGSWVIGAEYIQRTMEADFDSATSGIEADFGMLQLRAGYSF